MLLQELKKQATCSTIAFPPYGRLFRNATRVPKSHSAMQNCTSWWGNGVRGTTLKIFVGDTYKKDRSLIKTEQFDTQ